MFELSRLRLLLSEPVKPVKSKVLLNDIAVGCVGVNGGSCEMRSLGRWTMKDGFFLKIPGFIYIQTRRCLSCLWWPSVSH